MKTTEKVKNGVMNFSICSTDAYNLIYKSYTKEEIDLFIFYCIENGYCGLVKIEEIDNTKTFTIRIIPAKSCRKKDVHFYKDFELEKRIDEL